MTHGYDRIYLDDAMCTLGALFDCAINNFELSPEDFEARFIVSGLADAFSRGDPWCVSGHSGIELAMEMMRRTGDCCPKACPDVSISSREYWAGMYLAYYQWQSGLPMREIFSRGLSLSLIVSMYDPMHEADVSVFAQRAGDIVNRHTRSAGLKTLRKLNGLTQKQLAERSGVSIRLIRAYEQGAIDITHAESATVSKLASALRTEAL